MNAEEFENRTSNFVKWASKDAKLWISDKIELIGECDGDQGRYLAATKDISKGEVLFKIPRESVLNVSTLSLSEQNKEVRHKLVTEVGHWEGLAISILYEFKVMKQQSKWWPYFEVFPEPSKINSLMYWTDDELSHLKPSGVVERVGREGAKAMYQRVLKQVEELGIPQLCDVTWDEFVHVASVIMAYSFDMERADYEESEEEDEEEDEKEPTVWSDGYLKSMVPMADMLNSDTNKCNANLTYSPESLNMMAVADIPCGAQIYNIYGEYPNAELLRRYGYVEWTGSKYDCGDIPLNTLLEAAQSSLGVSSDLLNRILGLLGSDEFVEDTLEGEPLIMDTYDCYADGILAPELTTLAQVLTTSVKLPDLHKMNDQTLMGSLQRVVKKVIQAVNAEKITKGCLVLLESTLDRRLHDYPSHSFREPSPDHVPCNEDPLRRRMADCVLQSEVRSFQNCLKSLERKFKVRDDQQFLDTVLKRKLASRKEDWKTAHQEAEEW